MWVCRSPVHIGPRKVQQLYENLQQIRSIYAAVSVLFFQLFRLDDLCLDCSVLHALQLNAESGGKRPLDGGFQFFVDHAFSLEISLESVPRSSSSTTSHLPGLVLPLSGAGAEAE